MNKKNIQDLIKNDEKMMEILGVAKRLNLPDWMIGAGFVRNKVWDTLHKKTKTPLDDIDLIYFDTSNIEERQEKIYERKLKQILDIRWSVKNQARMHIRNNVKPYKSSEDAISYWPETATIIAVKLNKDNQIELITPNGTGDLVNLVIKINPNFRGNYQTFKDRVNKKGWLKNWPQLKLISL